MISWGVFMPRTRYTARYERGDGWKGFEAGIEVWSDEADVGTDELVSMVRDLMDGLAPGVSNDDGQSGENLGDDNPVEEEINVERVRDENGSDLSEL